jgi:hypothetical protein
MGPVFAKPEGSQEFFFAGSKGTFFHESASVNSRPAKHQTITFFEGR